MEAKNLNVKSKKVTKMTQEQIKPAKLETVNDTLNSTILGILECPLCLDFMCRPIFVCESGHSICRGCRDRTKNCPLCRTKHTKARNYKLEVIADLLSYPCPNQTAGCADIIKKGDEDKHKHACRYRLMKCLITNENNKHCGKQIPLTELTTHINDMHVNEAWMREESMDRWREHCTAEIYKVELIQAYDHLFYIHRVLSKIDNNPSGSYLYWAIQHVDSGVTNTGFGFEIHLSSDNFRTINYREVCHPEGMTVDQMLTSGKCVGIPISVFKTYMNAYKSVCFRVSIVPL